MKSSDPSSTQCRSSSISMTGKAARSDIRRSHCAAAWKPRARICLRVLQNAAQVRAGGEVEPDQVRQHVGV